MKRATAFRITTSFAEQVPITTPSVPNSSPYLPIFFCPQFISLFTFLYIYTLSLNNFILTHLSSQQLYSHLFTFPTTLFPHFYQYHLFFIITIVFLSLPLPLHSNFYPTKNNFNNIINLRAGTQIGT